MARQSNDLRERLLASLPQPENLTAYREETAALLANHVSALRSDKITLNIFLGIAVLLFWWSVYPGRGGVSAAHALQLGSAVLGFAGMFSVVRYEIYKSQIATLKEIKQVQLQILELQASLRRHHEGEAGNG